MPISVDRYPALQAALTSHCHSVPPGTIKICSKRLPPRGMQDDEVREGLKEFSGWPTYPQLYAHGDLVGGADIIAELAQGGELRSALEG